MKKKYIVELTDYEQSVQWRVPRPRNMRRPNDDGEYLRQWLEMQCTRTRPSTAVG